jgi:hypothetical protein
MRKGLAALAAAVFFLSVGGVAQAVIGVPDDVPGSTLLYPFFKVNPARTAADTQDTLLVVTNTAGPTTAGSATAAAQSGVAPNVAVHVTLWSAASVHVYDFSIILTPHDVWSCSLYDLIIGGTGCSQALPAPLSVRTALASTVDGKPTLIGYVTADLVYSPTFLFPGQNNYPFGYGNVLIGHMYLVNLINGSSTGFNAVSIETDDPCYGHPAVPVGGQVARNSSGFYRTRCEEEQGAAACSPVRLAGSILFPSCPVGGGTGTAYGDLGERIDGPNGDWAQTGNAGGFGITDVPPVPPGTSFTTRRVQPDSPLSLIVRYFSASAIEARTEVWQWKDRNTTASAGAVNVAVYDEAENVHSVQLNLPNEVNFALTSQIITPGAPGGWFRIKYPCSQFGSCAYDYLRPPGTLADNRTPIQAVAYAVQFAQSSNATLRWDAAFPAHRQYTNYLPGSSE